MKISGEPIMPLTFQILVCSTNNFVKIYFLYFYVLSLRAIKQTLAVLIRAFFSINIFHLATQVFSYVITKTHIFRVTPSKGATGGVLLKIEKKFPDFGKKCLDCVHLWVKFHI